MGSLRSGGASWLQPTVADDITVGAHLREYDHMVARIPAAFPSSLALSNDLTFKETTWGSARNILISPEGRAHSELTTSSKSHLMKVSYCLCPSTVGNWLLLQTPVLQAQYRHGCFEISVRVVILVKSGPLMPTVGQGRRTHQDLPLPEDRQGVDDCGGKDPN